MRRSRGSWTRICRRSLPWVEKRSVSSSELLLITIPKWRNIGNLLVHLPVPSGSYTSWRGDERVRRHATMCMTLDRSNAPRRYNVLNNREQTCVCLPSQTSAHCVASYWEYTCTITATRFVGELMLVITVADNDVICCSTGVHNLSYLHGVTPQWCHRTLLVYSQNSEHRNTLVVVSTTSTQHNIKWTLLIVSYLPVDIM